MKPGDLVADRFEMEHEAGAGGMGTVFRARDRTTGELVALKVLHGRSACETARFGRESSVLAELTHPGIVRLRRHRADPRERALPRDGMARRARTSMRASGAVG